MDLGLFQSFSIANDGELWGILSLGFLVLVNSAVFISAFRPQSKPPSRSIKKKQRPGAAASKPSKSWAERLSSGLQNSREHVWLKMARLLEGQKGLSEDSREEIESILYQADMPSSLIEKLLHHLERPKQTEAENQNLEAQIAPFFSALAAPVQQKVKQNLEKLRHDENSGPKVVLVVGVNGAGKTTSIGKLASRFQGLGLKVVVGACDTFRAAAVEQLQQWCDRSGAEIVKSTSGADPSAVAYQSLQVAQKENADLCLIDTAGRLHTAGHLMEELKKTKRVLQKLEPAAPHEIWLVIDSITGQNAMVQAREFHQSLNLTGIIFTKCDGSSKAGGALGIIDELQVPIVYIGVGESEEDLRPFELQDYLTALIGKAPLEANA